MIKEVVVYFKLRPYLKQLKELSSMPLSISRFFQILAVVSQMLNLVIPITSGKTKIIIATVLGCIQVILHNFAGNANPDGTPAITAYIPPVPTVNGKPIQKEK